MKTIYIVMLNIILLAPELQASSAGRFLLALSEVHGEYIEFWRPCNSKVLGIALKEKNETIHLAVALQLNYIQCGNIKSRERLEIPFDTRKKLKSLKLGARPLNTKYNKITYLHHNYKQSETKVIYRKSCDLQGDLLLISKDLKDRPNLSILSIQDPKTKNFKCSAKSKDLILSDISWRSKPKRLDSNNYQSPHYHSLRLRGAKHISAREIKYTRNCNEVPLSMVVEKNKAGITSLGVLLASYPNILCYEEKRAIHDSLKFTKIVFTNRNQLTPMKARRLDDTWMIGKVKPYKLNSQLKLNYLKACEKSQLVTYSENRGKALVGSLIRASSCSSRPKLTESKLPISFIHRNEKLFQLNVKGR